MALNDFLLFATPHVIYALLWQLLLILLLHFHRKDVTFRTHVPFHVYM